MTTPPVTPRQRDDHFFLAAQRWLARNDVRLVLLTCHGEVGAPLGTKRQPAVEVPGCVRDLPLHRFVDLSLAGVRDVALTPCSCCTPEDLATVVEQWRAALGTLLRFVITETTPVRAWSWSLSPTRVPVERRGLLGLRTAEQAWPTHAPEADDHARLLTSLRAAGVTSLAQQAPGVALLASGCTACGVCVAACPHDALTLTLAGDQTSLLQAPDACRGEQQCVALCPVTALSVSGPLPWSDVLEAAPRVLATLSMAVCQRCQARFPADSGSTWCEPCRLRRNDPFGSHLPPAAIALLRARGHESR
ncbi:4Fe-4S dicluster domain-containing protein [Tessaracoccus antarcticus]|nr:ferredoxin family protein [Tessaracoccus antarcticus]